MSPHVTSARPAQLAQLKTFRTLASIGLVVLAFGHFVFGGFFAVIGTLGTAIANQPLAALLPEAGTAGAIFGIAAGVGFVLVVLAPVLCVSAALLGRPGRFHFVLGALIITALVDLPFMLAHVVNLDLVQLALMAGPLGLAAYVAVQYRREERLVADWH